MIALHADEGVVRSVLHVARGLSARLRACLPACTRTEGSVVVFAVGVWQWCTVKGLLLCPDCPGPMVNTH
jgi:hypothetical protein